MSGFSLEVSMSHSEIKNNEESRNYFGKLNYIFSFASEAFELDGSEIISDYLKSVQNSYNALHLKHMYLGLDGSSRAFMYDKSGSGLPLSGEIAYIRADQSNAKDMIANLGSVEAIKTQLLDATLKTKAVPFKYQKKLSDRLYYKSITEETVFLKEIKPSFVDLTEKSCESNLRVHWGFYCAKSNQPVIFIMDGVIDPHPESKSRVTPENIANFYRAEFLETLKKCDTSNEKMLVVGNRIDEELEFFHPKKITRIHLGQIYCSGITEHSSDIEEILSQIKDENSNWLYTWGVEELISEKTNEEKGGFLSRARARESFIIPKNNHLLVEAACSNMYQNVIVPYRAYQVLSDTNNELLMTTNKFVIDNKHTMVKL